MKPEKFLQSYRCDCFQPDNYCSCIYKGISSDILVENVTDTAEALIEVMKLCGINIEKPAAISDVINYYFLHFEEIMHRIDSIPRKRLNKEDLMHDLSRKCFMNRRDSQMAFSVIKRAFKAFYHGTGVGGVPIHRLKDQLTHSSECLWRHAAQRTAQICACYEGMFYAAQKDLERKVKLIYKQLYDLMADRDEYNDDHDCICIKCVKRIAKETLQPTASVCDFHHKNDPFAVLFLEEQARYTQTEASAKALIKDKAPCTCDSLNMSEKDYFYRENAENTKLAANQSPFGCRWRFITKQEFEADEVNNSKDFPETFASFSDEVMVTEDECACEDCSCNSTSDWVCEAEIEEFVDEEISNDGRKILIIK